MKTTPVEYNAINHNRSATLNHYIILEFIRCHNNPVISIIVDKDKNKEKSTIKSEYFLITVSEVLM